MTTSATVRRLLKAHRESLGLSRQSLADTLGVNRSAVFKWEQGQLQLPWDRLDDWANAVGCHLVIVVEPGNTGDMDPEIGRERVALITTLTRLVPSLTDDQLALLSGMVALLESQTAD